MPICEYCGEEIEFRYINGRPTPIHLSGGWCQGGGERISYSTHASIAAPDFQFEDICQPTRCPECGAGVFFIRHNGGSVWLDDLGWPWPKHSCFDKKPVPSWFGFIKNQTISKNISNTILLGVIIRAKSLSADELGPFRIVLAVDCGKRGRACLAISGVNSANYFLGQVAIIDTQGVRLVTSKHEVRSILPIFVNPVELELPTRWATMEVHKSGMGVSSL